MSKRLKRIRKHKKERQASKISMAGIIEKAKQLGLTNAERLSTLNKSGIVTAQHVKILSKLKRLCRGNNYNADGNDAERRYYFNCNKMLKHDQKYLKDRKLQFVKPDIKLLIEKGIL